VWSIVAVQTIGENGIAQDALPEGVVLNTYPHDESEGDRIALPGARPADNKAVSIEVDAAEM